VFPGKLPVGKKRAGKVICPGGFWGFRHCVSMPLSLDAQDVPVTIPLKDNLNICVAISEDLGLYAPHIKALENLKKEGFLLEPKWTVVKTYDDVFALLKKSPHIVYFYCHGGAVRSGTDSQDPYLLIGPKEHPNQIHASNFSLEKIVWQSPKPLVFLNGCRTGAIDPLTALNLISPLLQKCHGAGVIGTEITIFENMATVFAEDCLKRFLDGEPIGSAVRNARLKVLSTGNPLALAYIPFAMADLQLKHVGKNEVDTAKTDDPAKITVYDGVVDVGGVKIPRKGG